MFLTKVNGALYPHDIPQYAFRGAVNNNQVYAWSLVVCGCWKLGKIGVCNTLRNAGLLDFVSIGLGLAEVRCWEVCVDNVRRAVITFFTLYLIVIRQVVADGVLVWQTILKLHHLKQTKLRKKRARLATWTNAKAAFLVYLVFYLCTSVSRASLTYSCREGKLNQRKKASLTHVHFRVWPEKVMGE